MKKTIASIITVSIGLLLFAVNYKKTNATVKQSVSYNANVPGFFPSNSQDLTFLLDTFFSTIKTPRILIVPHAGYAYSGNIAAKGYQSLLNHTSNISTVILIGPSHKASKEGISLWNATAWQNSLGSVNINTELMNKILTNIPKEYLLSESWHNLEHSLKVQLPFLQKIIPHDFSIVPILTNSINSAQSLAVAIYKALKSELNETLIVISTDLSHYHSIDEAVKKDRTTINTIASLNTDQFISMYQKQEIQACGSAAILTAMFLSNFYMLSFEEIAYSNSAAAILGNKNSVVGYVSAMCYEEPYLDTHKEFLLKVAKQAIKDLFNPSKKATSWDQDLLSQSQLISKPSEVFITIKTKGVLRGCRGNPGSPKPLLIAVKECAQQAAQDSRFVQNPVLEREINSLGIDVSILGKRSIISNPLTEIALGIHGIIIEKNNKSALFLPEVALEQGWSLETTLEQLCQKAGLFPYDWQNDAKMQIFVTKKIKSPSK